MNNLATATPHAKANEQIIAPDEILVPIDDVSPLQRQFVNLIISIVTKNESSNLRPRIVRDATRQF